MSFIVDAIKTFFESVFGNAYLVGFIISMIPMIELKGGILYMILQTGNVLASFAVGFLGSTIIAPVLLLIFMPIITWMKKTKLLKGIAEWLEKHFKKKSVELENKAEEKSGETEEARLKNIERAKYIGLFIFTAIPLPLTGCWTASVVASILHLDYKKSLLF
ncbi:MAG: small multi-drug export protein, partial [Clostridia bacterium]|nr:small multi-drug export protein [Clostridia bacterium]